MQVFQWIIASQSCSICTQFKQGIFFHVKLYFAFIPDTLEAI